MAESRVLYPLVRISVLKMADGKLLGCRMTPLALLVIEPEEQYAISLTSEELSLERIMELAPDLRAVVEEARRIQRITVS